MCVGPAHGQNEGPSLVVESVLELLLFGARRRRRMVSAHKVKDKCKGKEMAPMYKHKRIQATHFNDKKKTKRTINLRLGRVFFNLKVEQDLS